MSCLTQAGASYHESPISTSGLPSLLTSATATPSERNLPSIVVFFQETGVSLSAPSAATAITERADPTRTAIVRYCLRIGGEFLDRGWFRPDLGGEACTTNLP